MFSRCLLDTSSTEPSHCNIITVMAIYHKSYAYRKNTHIQKKYAHTHTHTCTVVLSSGTYALSSQESNGPVPRSKRQRGYRTGSLQLKHVQVLCSVAHVKAHNGPILQPRVEEERVISVPCTRPCRTRKVVAGRGDKGEGTRLVSHLLLCCLSTSSFNLSLHSPTSHHPPPSLTLPPHLPLPLFMSIPLLSPSPPFTLTSFSLP